MAEVLGDPGLKGARGKKPVQLLLEVVAGRPRRALLTGAGPRVCDFRREGRLSERR